jgi:hypothetical protein
MILRSDLFYAGARTPGVDAKREHYGSFNSGNARSFCSGRFKIVSSSSKAQNFSCVIVLRPSANTRTSKRSP